MILNSIHYRITDFGVRQSSMEESRSTTDAAETGYPGSNVHFKGLQLDQNEPISG